MNVSITEKAANEVKRIIDEQKPEGKMYLRMRVTGGGCSGFQHKLDLDDQYDEKKDEILEQQGIGVVVDKRSMLYLDGANIDFIDDRLDKRGFLVSNPNSKATCGCGSSFTM